jgi:hypothetical protein
MFCYKCIREHIQPGLKPNDKLLFTRQGSQSVVVLSLMSVMYKRFDLYRFSKPLAKIFYFVQTIFNHLSHVVIVFNLQAFKNLYKFHLLYITDISNRATAEPCKYQLVIGYKPGIMCSLKMVHLSRNMSEIYS